jgi:hypothetical protein
LSESGSETESEEERRRHDEKATKQKQNDNFVYSVSEDENEEEKDEENEQEKHEEEFDWEATGKDPQLFTESNYSQPFGPRIVPTDFRSPIGYFLLFFSNTIMELIIEQTKLYAEKRNRRFYLNCLN